MPAAPATPSLPGVPRITAAWVAALLVLTGHHLAGEDQEPHQTANVTLLYDNDVVFDEDNYFTNGVGLGAISAPHPDFARSPMPSWLATAIDRDEDVGKSHLVFFELNHRIFTPDDIQREDPDPGDMPYSAIAMAYVGASRQDEHHLDAFTLGVGVIGPAALGEQIQNGSHAIVDANRAEGWDHQLGNEFLLNAFYHRRDRIWRTTDGGLGADATTSISVAGGNLITAADAGLTLRFGWNIPEDFRTPTPLLSSGLVGSRSRDPRDAETFSCHGFLHANASLLGNVIIWEGNTFRDSRSVDYERHLVRGVAGVVWQQRWCTLIASGQVVSIPFDNPNDDEYDLLSRITLQLSF